MVANYYEFNNQEYYALIVTSSLEKAYEFYLNDVGGDSLEQIKEEGALDVLNPIDALIKYGLAEDNRDRSFKEVFNEFKGVTNGLLLIDGSLV